MNFNSDDAAVNEGNVDEFSFVEFLQSSQDLFNSEESGIAELLPEGTGDDPDLEGVDSPSEVESQLRTQNMFLEWLTASKSFY